tara:strand:+ start:325 stop:7554 length:7230 start_codon:yes stop_codon:yes gene_type:complete
MAQYDLPNNKKLNVPDNLDPALREKLAGAIQRQFGVDINETTVLGQAEETLKGIPRGAISLATDAVLGPASLFDIGNDSDFVQGLQQYKDFLNTESSLAADPAYRDKWMTKLGEGLGSFAPFLAAGKLGQVAKARGIGGTGVANPMFAVPAALAVPSGIAQQADRVNSSRGLGEDVGGVAETFAELGGGIVGLSEILPVFNLLKRVPKNALQYSDIRRKLSSALQSGAAEGLQEVSASLAQDLIARGLYSDELPIGDSLFDEFTIGGAVGALADLGVNAMSGRSRGRQYLYDREQQARKNVISLDEENKFQKAEAQGVVEEITDLPDVVKPDIPLPPTIIPGPQLEVIQDAAEKFAVVDLQNTDSPILQQFDTEVEALNFKNKEQTNYERKKLKVNLDNATYSLGMPNSATAYKVGATINDPNTSSINLQTLVNFDSTLSEQQKKLFSKEKIDAGFVGKNTYSEMIERKKAHLKQIGKYVKSKGLDLRASYTMPEVAKVLNKKDYNILLNDMANMVFQQNEKSGEPSITSDKEQPNVNIKYLKDIAASKNIDLDFKDPAVRYAALQWTGTPDIPKTRNRGVKELFLARLHSLPQFNNRTKFPDFRPRKYTAQDVANFVASRGSQNIEFNVNDLLSDGVTANDKVATEQFIGDLTSSGRAEKIEGTNKYRIRPNHEFDIARRAEGFNETPQEFGDRLRRENKLPEETIVSLVEQERQRQRKVLPPDEIDKKVFNFREAVEEGRTNKFAKELKKELDRVGLSETGLVVSNDILSTTSLVQTKDGEIKFDPRDTRATEALGAVEGEYDKDTDIIFLSLNAVNPDGTATEDQILQRLNQVLDHEMIHAFRGKDLITEPEYQYLRKEVKRKKVPSTYDSQYKNRTFYQRAVAENQNRGDLAVATNERKEELYVEEAIAEMFRSRSHAPDIAPKAKGILGKITEFFQSMGRAMRMSGFKRSSDIFNDIEQGVVGARERDQIRTLRELDRLPPQLIDAPIAQEYEEGEAPDIGEPTDVTTLGEDGGIATPVTTFEDVAADTDPITGLVITPSGLGRTGGGIFNRREQTTEQLQAQKAAILKEFGHEHRDSVDVLTWLSKNAPGKDYKLVADRLLAQVKKLKRIKKIDFQFRIIRSGADRLNMRGHKGGSLDWLGVSYAPFVYDGGFRQQVYINDVSKSRSGINGVDFETILHEFIHQATQAATYNPGNDAKTRQIIDDLEKIRKRVREEINAKKRAGEDVDFYVQYGTKNIQELMAVGFTDREFQKFMEGISYAPRGKKSLWDKFTETIRKILNIPAKQGTAFSEFLLQAGKITNLSQKQIRATLGGREALGGFDVGPPIADQSLDDSLNRFRQRIINKDPLTPEQEAIQSEINELQQQLYPLESEMRQEGGLMSRRNYQILDGKITNIKNQISGLEQEFRDARKEPKSPKQLALFSRSKRFAEDKNTAVNKQLTEATEKAIEVVKETPRGEIPHYNVNASDVALKAAIDFNEDVTAKVPPKDIPNYSRGAVPTEFVEAVNRTGYAPAKNTSLGATLLDVINNPIESVRASFVDFRQNFVDKLDKVEKKILQGSLESEDVRLANNSADTSTMAAMRLADKARGIFQGMLMRGVVSDSIAGTSALTNVNELDIDTKYNPFIDGNTGKGGLMQIMSPLYADPTVDLEAVFALYGKINRVKTMQDNGREVASPITEKDKAHLETIRRKYPVVVEVYNNYQKWNNKLIEFAEAKGLLNAEQSAMWRAHSSYYPFYRDMVDEEGLAAPTIGGGSLPSNPLNIKMTGSEEEIRVNPVEAIARNSLSILTGAMKNDGTSKLLRDLESMGEARQVTPRQKKEGNLNTIFVFEDGNKQYYEVDDVELFHGIQAIGGVKTDAVTKFLAFPSAILRDTVTRDPGFVIVNLLRDTLSSAITSGAPLGGEGFTPVIDTVKNMFADMTDLEKFGVIGGYDFQNDEGSVVELMERARRQQGLTPDNGISAKDGFFKVWDTLGALTTKSDGATRLAVYNAVYNDMKNRGFNEAQAQSEAAYQSLEIINFGRRGLSPLFRVITAAIPFLNARIQGLDVLYRSATGKYSAIDKLEPGETLDDVKNKIMRKFGLRAGTMIGLTALYYLLVSDTDEYKEVKREVRDDNWIIPIIPGYPTKIPIPFEVGMLFKAIPERLIDMAMGEDAVEKAPLTSITRQLGTSAEIPIIGGDIGIQALKPIFEAVINRNSFTNTEIVPYYKLKEMPAYQARQSTNEVARLLGEALNISPIKIEHVISGYTGTLGGYVLDIMDVFARGISGTPIMPPNINDIPVIKRLFIDADKSGGLQQQFYELREVVDGAVLTLNDLKRQGRFDELSSFREHNKGVFQVKGQIRAIERYMTNWRKRRDRLLRRDDLSPLVKSDMLRDMELERDKRLAIVPTLRERADVPAVSLLN